MCHVCVWLRSCACNGYHPHIYLLYSLQAWEFFLLRPRSHWDQQLLIKHLASVKELQFHVKKMLSTINFGDNFGDNKSNLFVHKLYDVCKELQDDEDHTSNELLMQSALEMMLAGTDTSSVTAYYALLGLAGNSELQSNLRKDLQATNDASKAKVLRGLVDETLRFKPVGPVVLREAVEEDPNFPGDIHMEKGTAILIHLAEMNLSENLWPNPKSFCPMRFIGKEIDSTNKKFFPFGHGPKVRSAIEIVRYCEKNMFLIDIIFRLLQGCIGMHLGRREVNTILKAVVMNYDMKICGEGSLDSLETHWDIANQPDNPTLIELVKICED